MTPVTVLTIAIRKKYVSLINLDIKFPDLESLKKVKLKNINFLFFFHFIIKALLKNPQWHEFPNNK